MIEVVLSREEFLSWVANPRARDMAAFRRVKSTGNISLCWPGDSLDDEPMVAVPAAELREFLAFVTTYVATYVPFTAFFRVVPRELVEVISRGSRRLNPALEAAIAGAVICDAAYQATPSGGGDRKVSEISIQACLAGPGSSMLAAAMLGYDEDVGAAVLERWSTVRTDLRSSQVTSPGRSLSFWSSVLPIVFDTTEAGSASELHSFARAVVAGRGVAPDVMLSNLAGPLVPQLGGALRENRERRVQVLDELQTNMQSLHVAPERQEMLIGYVLAQVAEGSLSYLPLALRASNTAPAAVLWYGFFSGLNQNSDVLSAGESLGRRIVRTFDRYLGQLPPLTSDVSYEQFLMIVRERRLSVRTAHQAIIDVELFPGVRGIFRLQRAERAPEVSQTNAATLTRLRRLVDQMNFVLRDGERVAQQSDLFNDPNPPEPLPQPKVSKSTSKKKQAR